MRWTIDGDKLIELLTIERDKAEVWRRDCEAFGSTQLLAATQAVLDFNKAISLAKGLQTEKGEADGDG